MSDNTNPTGSNNFSTVDLLPKYYRTDDNRKFIQATIDQLTQKGTAKKVNGFIGRKNAKSANAKDIYINAPTTVRQDYQLEPAVVVNDSTGNVDFFKDYQDFINQLKVFGGNVDNHERLNRQEFYSWDPHIDWDKFINFQQYYWLPYGPDVVNIVGQQLNVTSTFKVELSTSATQQKEYVFTPNGLDRNPVVTLYRGQTYYFEIDSPGEPFSIKTARTLGTLDRYTDEGYVSNFGVTNGTIKFIVPISGPDTLYYVSERDPNLGSIFKFLDITENTYINLETDLIGKKTYTLSNGTPLSNGMKVAFGGNVTPESYATGEYYVEGVGTAINLIPTNVFEVISTYTEDRAVAFDSTLFDQYPFAAASSYAGKLDYVTINKASKDRNPWSRYNRWFHKDTINASAAFNNKLADFDQTSRATRPIIEFNPDLKLFNFGVLSAKDVDLVDSYTKDVFSTIEGTAGYNIDGVDLAEGMRILFLADVDPLVKNNVYKVTFVNIENSGIGAPQIRLLLDESPAKNSNILVRQGQTYQGKSFWYNETTWVLGQQKTTVNQSPLFDMFDENKQSFSSYSGSRFAGNKIFSYKLGTTTPDSVLGFSLSYQNINNVGDILFSFDLVSDTFEYKENEVLVTKSVNTGFLSKLAFNNDTTYVNGWQTSKVTRYQPGIRIYKDSNLTNNFPLDIYDNKTNLLDLEIRIFVNGIRVDSNRWTLVDAANYKQIKFTTDLLDTDVLTIKAFSAQPINANGFYEIPINLQNNPLNVDMKYFTLGEVADHLNSIVDNIQDSFVGVVSGSNNLRDLGNVTAYGTKFIQHSGPASLALYHITSEQNNIIRALEKSRDDYGKFKHNFLLAAQQLGTDTDVVTQVDLILKKLSANKTKKSSYYFSDMVPFTGKKVTEYTVVDNRIRTYPLTTVYSNTELSNKAVSIYLNGLQPPTGTQLLYGVDYVFTTDGYVSINNTVELADGDVLTVFEYDSTDGCFIPPTPTKLGLWPKFEPKIYVDYSLLTPRTMIQGHDGSQTLSYGDYRDNIILELEKRIYNNLQIQYDSDIFDIYDIIPGYYRNSEYSLDEINQVLSLGFYKWANLVGRDFSKQVGFNKNSTFTYNYRGHPAPDGRELPGYWRGIFRWVYDTDRPNICPWEMLGMSEEPSWWQQQYGPAPYTSNNIIMWKDLEEGAVKAPGMPTEYRTQFARPDLLNHLPVDESGNLVSPVSARLATGVFNTDNQDSYIFGDVAPVEAAWRRSSHYPFSILIASMILKPAHTLATCLDKSRTVRNLCGQLVYKDTGLHIKPRDILLPSISSSSSRVYTAGIINYLIEYLINNNVSYYDEYQYNLDNLDIKLSYRVSGFTSKNNFNLILDSKNPASTGNVFVPPENYKIFYNSSSPIAKLSYSGIIITKLSEGYEIKGYSLSEAFFKYLPPRQELGPRINVGGISAPFVNWTAGKTYSVGQTVFYNGKYYRTLYAVTPDVFDSRAFAALPELPVTGGVNAVFRNTWDTSSVNVLPYGTVLAGVQQVVDFILGYGEYLKTQGFIFEDFNNNLQTVSNWNTTAKEFMFWTTQKWSTGQDTWQQWIPNQAVGYGTIVKYQDIYYRALQNIPGQLTFTETDYVKLDGLNTVGSAVISLSPAANSLSFSSVLSVAEDINNPFNEYEIYKVDGSSLTPADINSNRQGNVVTFSPDDNGTIYNASFYLVQKEQVLILDNATVFNDVIYNPESGYRQERIKVSGFVSSEWFGGFEVPGFVFDRADIKQWSSWVDYTMGDIVSYQGYYYSAVRFLPGTDEFESNNWMQIKKPQPALLPNWSYKAGQFEDFYNLDQDNFDTGQQKIAQHLIGYQKRQYLSNIIQDNISEFQFYQGMIKEKGTQNSLNKLFDVLSAENKESLTFYEEWGIRVGQYGASQAYEAVEFLIEQPDLTKNPQGFYLTIQPKASTNYNVNISSNDVYVKPRGYNAEPWPVNNTQKLFLRTPGYVQPTDQVFQINTLDTLLTTDVTSFDTGMYIWVTFEKTSWNIYRFSSSDINPSDATYNSSNKTITIFSSNQLDSSLLGQYVALKQIAFAGFYKVVDVNLQDFTIEASSYQPGPEWPTAETISANLEIFRLYSVRASSIDNANDIIKEFTSPGDKIWIDDDSTNKWAELELTSVYNSSEIRKPYPTSDMAHGRVVVTNLEGTVVAVSTQVGEVIVYSKQGPRWIFKQIIKRPFMSQNVFGQNPNAPDTFASTMAMSPDGEFLAIGSPRVGNLATKQQANGNIVCDPSAVNSSNLLQGAVSLYQKTSYDEYLLLFTIVSGDNTANQQFGSSLAFGNGKLFIGSTGPTSIGTQATIYELRYVAVEGVATVASNSNADGDDANAVVTIIYDGGTASTIASTNDIVFDGGTALPIENTGDRWLLTKPGISITNGTAYGFGAEISVTNDNSILVVAAPLAGNVYIYSLDSNNSYNLLQTIAGPSQAISSATTTDGVFSFNGNTLSGGTGFRNTTDKFLRTTIPSVTTTGGSGAGLVVDVIVNSQGSLQTVTVRDPGQNYKVNDVITIVNPLGTGGVLALTWATSVFNSGVQYKIGDTVVYNGNYYVAIQNTLNNSATNATYWSPLTFASSITGTDIVTTTNRSGSNLKVKLAHTTTPGALSGSIVIPVTNVTNFELGQLIFSSTVPTAFALDTYITQVNSATYSGVVQNNVLTVDKITNGLNPVVAEIIGSITDKTLTIEQLSGASIIPGMQLSGDGINEEFIIVSGSGTIWTISNAITISTRQIKATLYETIKPGMQLGNPALDTASSFTATIQTKGTASLTGATTTLLGGVALMYNATIAGITLTFDAVTGGDPVAPGMVLTGAGITTGTKILYGSGNIWTVDTSQTIASPITITGTLVSATISGSVLSFSAVSGATLEPGMILSGGTVIAGTTITGGSGTSWTVSPSQSSTCTTAKVPNGTISGNTLTFTASSGATVETGMVLLGGTVLDGTIITGGSGTTWYVNINQSGTCERATSQATLINGQIDGTILTFTDNIGIALFAGMILTGSGVLSGTYVVSGSELEWVVSISQTVLPTTITGTPVVLTANTPSSGLILLGQRLSGNGVTSGTAIIASGTGTGKEGTYYVSLPQTVSTFAATSRYIITNPVIINGITITGAAISGTTLTFSGQSGGNVQIGMLVTGSNVLAGTKIISGSSGTWQINLAQTVVSTTLLLTGTGQGGTGTYILDQELTVGLTPTVATSLTINTPLAATLTSSSEVTSLKISNQGFGYSTGDTITFNRGGGQITMSVSTVTSNGSIAVATIGDGSVTKDSTQFGQSVAISKNGDYVAIGSPLQSDLRENEGRVYILSNNSVAGNTYREYQQILNPRQQSGDLFGYNIKFASDYKTLLIYSPGADSFDLTTFDETETIFDSGSLMFKEISQNSGRIDVYDRYSKNWISGESLYTGGSNADGFGQSFAASDNTILVGAPHESEISENVSGNPIIEINSGKVYSYEKMSGSFSWTPVHKQTDLIDIKKIKQSFLYNKISNKLIRYLDIIDPSLGKIAGPAEQEISYKTFYDPAIYTVGTSSVNVDIGNAWQNKQTGKLWWDLRTAKFIDNHSENLIYRNSTLNMLASGASIDIYEWVETQLTPTEWKVQADTDAGLANNISGTPLYTDSYSVKQYFNAFNNAFENTYYFWVKNKKLIPNVADRKISANAVSELISNPRGQGYPFIALTGKNSFSLINCQNLLNGNNVILGIEYWIIEQSDQNIHAQWKLIDNSTSTQLPAVIEEKWFDSLCGKDQADRPVPDLNLPAKLRYGIESRPRQGMFVNNFEALKQFVERVNLVLIKEQIVGQRNISKLESYDAEPQLFTGVFDTIVDTDAELQIVSVSTAKSAVISPVIVNGSIVDVIIQSPGSGYKSSPTITIKGSGVGAKLKAIINIAGVITGAEIISKGKGYTNSTTLEIRPFSVLVRSDSAANGNWSIYSYITSAITGTQSWVRVKTQSYDVRNYWNKVDWYATGFNQFSIIDFAVDVFAELGTIDPEIGQTVKVRMSGTTGWQLLLCYSKSTSNDWTQRYQVIGIENGTLQLSSKLYSFVNNNIGYDSSIYDNTGYDYTASKELRIMLNSLKDDILIDTLKSEYLNLFFASVRYAHTEQTYIDWAFKTSFVKAQHNVGELKQTTTYTNDNLENFQDYINEVVPYRTTVRKFVSNYTATDDSFSVITDFDLPAVFGSGNNQIIKTQVKDGKITSDRSEIQTYPWKHWLSNVGFQITAITLIDNGAGYVTAPAVRIISDSGSGAVAQAFIANGKVSRILLVSPGTGYLSAPTIIVDGGSSASGRTAKAVAIIGKSNVRSSLIKMKFDRTTNTYYTIQLNETHTFLGTGNKTNFALAWAPDVKIGQSTVKIDNALVLRDNYTLTTVKSTAKGYTTYSGVITLKTAPALGATITVEYLKDIDLLNASDRIQYYYNPTTGQLGKSLDQLMTGVDYGGVIVTGLDYSVSQGWNSVGFMQDLWDSYENTYNDYAVTIDNTTAISRSFTLPYIPETFTNINVYYSKIFNTAFTSDGSQLIYTLPSANTFVDDIQINLDKTVFGVSLNVTATSTEQTTVTQMLVGFNYLKTASTENLSLGKAIKIISGAFGGFITNQTYYVVDIIDSTTFKVGSSVGGSEFTVAGGTGNMIIQYPTSSNYLTGPTASLFTGLAFQFTSTVFGGLATGVTYYVKEIVSSTLFTVSRTVDGSVLPVSSAQGIMPLNQVAAAPAGTVRLNNISGLKVGDIATCSIPGAIAEGTAIQQILTATNQVVLTNILYGDILAGIQINFVRALVAPIDFRYLTPVSLQLSEPPVAGATINITSSFDPVRIDDENFAKQWVITGTEASTNVITTITPITFNIGDTIGFTGTVFGNIQLATTYYIKEILTNRTFKISATLSGPEYVLVSASGSMIGRSIGNSNAVMATYIADGSVPIITIPSTYTLTAGDTIIFRKSSSDGAVPVSATDFDTALDGGTLEYNSATGLSPDDIIIDGDGFVTADTSGAPEEVVPGQVVDSVAIKVFDRPSDGSATVKVLSYIADGVNKKFSLEQFPNSKDAVYIKLNSTVLTIGTDYYLDYPNKQVILRNVPAIGSIVTLHSFGFNGTNILDADYFVADGKTKEFITKAPYVSTDFNYLVYLDGVAINPTLFKTDNTYDSPNRIGFRFSIAPAKLQTLNYLIVLGNQQTYAIFKNEKLATNGNSIYTLSNTVGSSVPLESSVLVRANQQILQGPKTTYFTISGNQYTYTLDILSVQPYSINSIDLTVYADGNLLELSTDYTVDTSGVSISINRKVYSTYKGKRLVINVKSDQDYYIVGNTITFAQSYSASDYVEVVSAYKHDILQIQRTRTKITNNLQFNSINADYYRYVGVLGGRIELPSTILTEPQLWVTKNKVLLINGVDYRVNPDLTSITLDIPPAINDEFELIIFAGESVKAGISYMQFKDMLNRTVYKRLNLYKQNELIQDLYYYDKEIFVKDAGNFDKPNPAINKPGVVEINGERIEYFTIKNNTTLGQLRRGTLGTGVPTVHGSGSKVQDIGPSETIPYVDTFKTEQITIDNYTTKLIIPLSFVPSKTTSSWSATPGSLKLFDNAVIQKFVSKTGTGPYLVTFAVPQQSYAPALNKYLLVSNNGNTNYNGYHAVSSSNISNNITIVPQLVNPFVVVGTAIDVTFTIPTQTTAPVTGIYYVISGSDPIEYNGAWLCSSSTTTSITLSISNNYGVFKVLPSLIKSTHTISVLYDTDPGVYSTKLITTISASTYGEADEIEVFVGGYDTSTVWEPNTIFDIDQILTINSYTYRVTTKHRSGATFNSAVSTIDSENKVISTEVPATSVRTFFVGNTRLKKSPYSVYNVEKAPASPEGDVNFVADFAVDGINKELVLTNKLTTGTVVTIIRKFGQSWTLNNESLQTSQTKIAKFITAVPGVWVTSNRITSTQTGLTAETTTFDNVTKSFDNDDTTFDQGN